MQCDALVTNAVLPIRSFKITPAAIQSLLIGIIFEHCGNGIEHLVDCGNPDDCIIRINFVRYDKKRHDGYA